jgi:hypothetical protein
LTLSFKPSFNFSLNQRRLKHIQTIRLLVDLYMTTMPTANVLDIVSWLQTQNMEPLAEMVEDTVPNGELSSSWTVEDEDLLKMLKKLHCPLLDVPEATELSIMDWTGAIAAAKAKLHDDHKIVRSLEVCLVADEEVPIFLRKRLCAACPSIRFVEDNKQAERGSAPKSQHEVNLGSGVAATGAHHRATKPNSSHAVVSVVPESDSSCSYQSEAQQKSNTRNLSECKVWINNRVDMKYDCRIGVYALSKRIAEQHPEWTDAQKFAAVLAVLKLHAKNATVAIVDGKLRLGWTTARQRQKLLKRARDAVRRWTQEWIGEVKGQLSGMPATNCLANVQRNLIQRYNRFQNDLDYSAPQATKVALGHGRLQVGTHIRVVSVYLTIEAVELLDDGLYYYQARHCFGDLLTFEYPPWLPEEKETRLFPATELSEEQDCVVSK